MKWNDLEDMNIEIQERIVALVCDNYGRDAAMRFLKFWEAVKEHNTEENYVNMGFDNNGMAIFEIKTNGLKSNAFEVTKNNLNIALDEIEKLFENWERAKDEFE